MPKVNNLSQREKLLLPLALTVIILVVYVAARIRPALAQVAKLRQELTTEIQRRDQLAWPSQNGSNPENLRSEIHRLERDQDEQRQRLRQNEATLADITQSADLQKLRIQISALAKAHDIHVVKNLPYQSNGNDAMIAIDLDQSPKDFTPLVAPIVHEYFQLTYARPLQQLELRATYAAIQGFIRSLTRLEQQVNVVSFHLKMEATPNQLTQPQLKSSLVLAL